MAQTAFSVYMDTDKDKKGLSLLHKSVPVK